MRRRVPSAIAVTIAVVLAAPAAAQARTPCPAEATAPTAANSAQVSDAIVCLTNQLRASYGLPAFRRDARLDTAARLHSEDMAARDFFAHTTPEGLAPGDRASAQGYAGGVGENIAAGYATARSVIVAWMASAGHCRNILGAARDIGVGTAPSPRPNYTQDFGNHAAGAAAEPGAGCPYPVDLDALSVPDLVGIVAAAPAAVAPAPAPAAAAAPAAAPAAAAPASARPLLTRLAVGPARLRPGGRAVVRYTLSAHAPAPAPAPATVTLRIERAVAGRRARWRTLPGSLTDAGEPGRNALAFGTRVGGRRLPAGRYRLRAVATDAAGRASAPRRTALRIVAR